MKNFIIHKASSRGYANHGWLQTHHTFSFADYFNPERNNFGVLRVLNDDIIAAGEGFGTHPHENMEIITIPLQGDLEHKDSMGNTSIIKHGDVQVMSAGTGIYHSEFNPNKDKILSLLQIWVFPDKKNHTPRYDQITLNIADRHNKLQQILSPNSQDEGVWIHQQAWFHIGDLDKGTEITYDLKLSTNGIYIFVINGKLNVLDNMLDDRDGMGIWNTEHLSIEALEHSELLIMEIPM